MIKLKTRYVRDERTARMVDVAYRSVVYDFGFVYDNWKAGLQSAMYDLGSYPGVAEKPGAFGWLGTTPEGETVWPLHSSHYAPDENVLWKGAALLAQMAIDS